MHWIKVAILRRIKVIKDKLKQVTFVVQGSHVTHSPLVCLIVKEFVLKRISPEACWLKRLIPGR